jgi:uncharacterized phage protein (TIGR01671 family)
MRNIKFRGKRKDNGAWIYGDLFNAISGITIIENGGADMSDFHFVIPETVGMLVGVKDKNGEEYYHGDIFRLDSWTTPINEIVYNRGGFCFRHSKDDAYYSDIKYAEDGVKIGNVFDNPELLTK